MKAQVTYPTSQALGEAEKTAVEVQSKATTRILFVDSIRIFLTLLVVLHHLMVIYSGSGGWIYKEGRQDEITSALGGWFTSVNHAYFMGLFLLVSAYFVPGSYDRKGAARFLKDRLIRLGIPLIVYSWILRPVFIYAGYSSFESLGLSFTRWYIYDYFRDYGWIGGGPLWFIEALLILSMLYVVWRLLVPSPPERVTREAPFPSTGIIALFAALLGVLSFLVRLWFPSDTVFRPLNFQLADFPQYIALFIVGLYAYRQNWFLRLPETTGRRWLAVAAFLILVYPPIAILGGAIEDVAPFKGGWHWQALLAEEWQSWLCIATCISLIYTFRRYFNHQGRLASYLSRNAYTVYLIHEPVITAVALTLIGVMLYPLLKFALAALIAIPLCFGLSSLIRKLPYTDRVL